MCAIHFRKWKHNEKLNTKEFAHSFYFADSESWANERMHFQYDTGSISFFSFFSFLHTSELFFQFTIKLSSLTKHHFSNAFEMKWARARTSILNELKIQYTCGSLVQIIALKKLSWDFIVFSSSCMHSALAESIVIRCAVRQSDSKH